MAARAQALHQRVAVDAGDRRLARRIDVRHDHRVGVVEAGARTPRTATAAAYSGAAARSRSPGPRSTRAPRAARRRSRPDGGRSRRSPSTPFHSPVRVKRRFTPPKAASALRICSSPTPSSRATAMAAVALSALCRPGIGSTRSCDLMHHVAGAVAEQHARNAIARRHGRDRPAARRPADSRHR